MNGALPPHALLPRGAVGPDQLMFLHDLLDLPQTGEWRTLYDAMDNAARKRGKRAVARRS